ncbi:MAG: hypothetical protein K2H17_01300 [Duncaniella sp.]|uniref:DUF5723 family protein n=1 Tax=Duncaniella sp. TaxID=2518496 RepID=UPI0023CEAAFA|nr:DUF5723 family protein [Duncaniella sp.]MDE5988012.1 hypothetical protein [Duncaniella sp.]
MIHNIKSLAGWGMAAVIALLPASVAAQNLQSGYFDDNYLYRFQSNPAFGNEGHGFVAMPGLGNLNLTTNGTIGVNHILYNVNGKTTTFLNPEVSASKVLDGLKDKSRLGVNLRETALAFGFKGFGGYNTVSVSARADVGIALPKDIFRLAKQGVENSTYDLSDLNVRGVAWGEIALGHSRQINKNLRVGATLKLLVGVGSIETNINSAKLQLREDTWVADVDAEIQGSLKNLKYKTEYNENTKRDYVNGVEVEDFSPISGYGMAVDLGAVYKLNDDWEFSASVLDLGFISWDNNHVASTNGKQQVVTDDYSFNVDNNDTWDKFKDNLSMLYQLEDLGDTGSRTSGIGATVNLGAQYTLPVYRRAKFGFLNTTRVNGPFTWTDFRLSANVEPVKFFSAGVNFGVGTFGPSFGWIVNLKTSGFNLFVASDHTPGKTAKQGVPLNSNTNVNLGINIPF